MRRLRFTPPKTYGLSKRQGLVRLKGLGKLKKKIHLSGSRTRDFLARSIVATQVQYRMTYFSRPDNINSQNVKLSYN
jgi:hypothetical protein